MGKFSKGQGRFASVVSATRIVELCWGKEAPSWIKRLAAQCDKTSQSDVSRKIGRTGAVISQILNNKYGAGLDKTEQRFQAVFGGGPYQCPVLGEISGERCLKEQEAPYRNYNHVVVDLYRACRRCPNCLTRREAGDDS